MLLIYDGYEPINGVRSTAWSRPLALDQSANVLQNITGVRPDKDAVLFNVRDSVPSRIWRPPDSGRFLASNIYRNDHFPSIPTIYCNSHKTSDTVPCCKKTSRCAPWSVHAPTRVCTEPHLAVPRHAAVGGFAVTSTEMILISHFLEFPARYISSHDARPQGWATAWHGRCTHRTLFCGLLPTVGYFLTGAGEMILLGPDIRL